jgi:hypothetical protein
MIDNRTSEKATGNSDATWIQIIANSWQTFFQVTESKMLYIQMLLASQH